MASIEQIDKLKRAWDALESRDMDALISCYADEMIFVLPGQNDVLEGRAAFRATLDNIGAALPPGFKINNIRYYRGEGEIVNVIEFAADKIPEGSQCAILFRFDSDDQIIEERWFLDTEQWKAAF